jgi:hypothetical protein
MLRRLPRPLLVACALYLLVRALVLYTNFDVVSMPIFELSAMGTVAKIGSEGWCGVPLHHYYDNCGGHIVTGGLAIPLYLLLGPTYLALKLVPVLLGLGCQILLWRLLDRWVGRTAANWGAFLFILGPPTLFKYSMLAKGNHFENLFFQLLVITAFDRAHALGVRGRDLFWTGVAAGFAVFFYFGSLAILVVLGVMHLLLRGVKRSVHDARFVIPGVLLGFAPLIPIGFATLERIGLVFGLWTSSEGNSMAFDLTGNARRLFVDILPSAGCFEDVGPIPGKGAEWLFIAVFVVAWVSLVPRIARGAWHAVVSKRSSEGCRFEELRFAPIVLYFPAVVGAILFGNFDFPAYHPPVEVCTYRYLVPHFFFATITIAAAIGFLHRDGKIVRRHLGTGLGIAFLATSVFTLPVVDWTFSHTGFGSRYDGFLWRYYNGVLLQQREEDPETGIFYWDREEVTRHAGEFPLRDRHEIYFGVGHYLCWAQDLSPRKGRRIEFDLDRHLEGFPEEVHIDLMRGLGSYLRARVKPLRIRQELIRLAKSGHPFTPYVVEGLFLRQEYPLVRETKALLAHSRRLLPSVPMKRVDGHNRGQGIAVGRLLARGIRTDLALIGFDLIWTEKMDAPGFWFGVGWAFAEQGEVGASTERVDLLVPDQHRSSAWLGFGAGLRHVFGEEEAPGFLLQMTERLSPDELPHVKSGLRWENYPLPLQPK